MLIIDGNESHLPVYLPEGISSEKQRVVYRSLAKENNVDLPGLHKIDEIYEEAVKAGYDDLDYAATIMLLEERAGLRLKGKA